MGRHGRRQVGLGIATVIVLLGAAACGDDSGGGDAATTTEAGATADVALDTAFCDAFGDDAWFAFNDGSPPTPEEADAIEQLAQEIVAVTPEELSEEASAMADATDGYVTTWREAAFDPDAVDRAALTDLGVQSADPVHRIEGLAEEDCGITRGEGGLFATD